MTLSEDTIRELIGIAKTIEQKSPEWMALIKEAWRKKKHQEVFIAVMQKITPESATDLKLIEACVRAAQKAADLAYPSTSESQS